MKKILIKILGRIYPQLNWLKRPDFDFSKLQSWSDNVTVEDHVRIAPVSVHKDVKIGRYTYIDYNSKISLCEIGRFCSIGPNFLCGYGTHPVNGISTSPMFYSTQKQNGVTLVSKNKAVEHKPIKIGNDVFIGANVTVLDGVTIGDGAVIGAGAIVNKDIPPYAIAVGCPIQVKKYRFTESQIAAMLRVQWWNWDEEKLKEIASMFDDVNGFITKYDTVQ